MSAVPTPSPGPLSLEQLRKQAKERLADLRAENPAARLADAQLALARAHGCRSWAALVERVTAADPRASAPRIVAPVTRHLGTRDRATALAFWRDVLGFEVRPSDETQEVELASGRARVVLGTVDYAPDYAGGEREPGTAVVFFDVDDVERMRAAIAQRGGRPSAIEKVNWIKRRVFEVRDPDGHALWFGESYHKPSPARPRRMLSRVMPELPVDDVPAAVRHYRDVLGFSVNYEQHDIGVLDRDEVRLLLVQRTPEHRGIGSAYFYVRDADGLHAELLRSGADAQGEPVSQPWGLREFSVRDQDGNRLTFGQTFE